MNEDELVEFVEEKGEIVHKLLPFRDHATLADKQTIVELIEQEQGIVIRMNEIKEEAASWLSRREMIRSQSNAYNSSYSMDSLFIDHRR